MMRTKKKKEIKPKKVVAKYELHEITEGSFEILGTYYCPQCKKKRIGFGYLKVPDAFNCDCGLLICPTDRNGIPLLAYKVEEDYD